MSQTTYLTTTYTLLTCYKATCGMTFGVPESWERDRRDDHGNFYCPNGHCQGFLDQSEAEKQRERAERAERDAQWQKGCAERAQRRAGAAEHQARAFKGVVTRTKKRIACGVCIACHRSFPNLRAHMAMKHPEIVKASHA